MSSSKDDVPKNAGESANVEKSGSDDVAESGERGRSKQQENLLTKVINVGGRSYYLDVRQNKRGKYLKLTEVSQQRRRTILLSGHLVGRLGQILGDIIAENYENSNAEEPGDNWTTIFSRREFSYQKKIYFDLMHNKNGRSLNIAEVPQQDDGRPKTAVIISEQGWLQLKRALEEISQEFPAFRPPAPRGESTQLATEKVSLENKKYFLDLIENQLGRFLKFSELRQRRRETIFVPSVALDLIYQLLENLEKDDLASPIDGLEDIPFPETERENQKTLLRRSFALESEDGNPADSRTFNLDYRENENGKFLRIVEVKPGKSSAVFVPNEGFAEIRRVLDEFRNIE